MSTIVMINDIAIFVMLLYYYIISNEIMLICSSFYSKIIKPLF